MTATTELPVDGNGMLNNLPVVLKALGLIPDASYAAIGAALDRRDEADGGELRGVLLEGIEGIRRQAIQAVQDRGETAGRDTSRG